MLIVGTKQPLPDQGSDIGLPDLKGEAAKLRLLSGTVETHGLDPVNRL